MPFSRVAKSLAEIERDDDYVQLKRDLLSELASEAEPCPGVAYSKVLSGVLGVLAEFLELEDDVKLNRECLILIEDVATSGKCRYPWKVVKMLVILVYSRLFDELYKAGKESQESGAQPPDTPGPSESSNQDSPRPDEEGDNTPKTPKPPLETDEEFRQLKIDSLLYVLEFDMPPFTLQRLCEIPLNQPYRVLRKLFNAYRKLFMVRNIEYEPEKLPAFVDLAQFPLLERVSDNLASWEAKYLVSSRPEWNEELFSENSDELESPEHRSLKRPLE